MSPIVKGPVETGKLLVQALATPGHSDDGLTFVVNGEAAFTGDTLFKNAVGGGDFERVKGSVMDVLMALPHDTHVYPGPHRRDDDRQRNGSRTRSSASGAGPSPRERNRAPVGGEALRR